MNIEQQLYYILSAVKQILLTGDKKAIQAALDILAALNSLGIK